MERKDFLKNTILTVALGASASTVLNAKQASEKSSTYDQLLKQVGFNHLPNKEEQTMNTVLHKASTRGHANHGWLDTNHTFSFANYYNPERMHFGVLRVLNDDSVIGGKGFGKHPHDNMEIVTIPLSGDLAHQDSMGNSSVIKNGEVQVMSAGTGLFHSEYNANSDKAVKFLQIWLFPNRKNVKPRYDQISIKSISLKNDFYQVLSPSKDDQGVWIHQNAWFHLGDFEKEKTTHYQLKSPENGLYVFMIEGDATVENQVLNRRDGLGIWNTKNVKITASANSKILLMDVPMNI